LTEASTFILKKNVDGLIWQAVLPLLNRFTRVPLCGLIAITTAPPVPSRIYYRQRCWRSCAAACCSAAKSTPNLSPSTMTLSCERSAPRVRCGDIRYREDIVDGLEKVPEAFIDMLAGRNFGKALVRLS
jgi:NADPH-dependent curcumin reductase CurA